jgi:hypothetical protein
MLKAHLLGYKNVNLRVGHKHVKVSQLMILVQKVKLGGK